MPLVAPAILSGLLLTFTSSMGNFGTAALLGLPTKFYTLSTMLYNSMNSRMPSIAYVLSLILIGISSIMIYINQKLIGRRKSYATVGGKDARKTLTALGRWRVPAAVGVFLFLLISGVIPLFLLIWQSFMQENGNYSLSNLTLHYWVGEAKPQLANGLAGILRSEQIWKALANSLKISLITACLTGLIGLLLGYVIARRRTLWLTRAIEQLSFLPYLIPGISLASIFLVMFAKPHPPIPALYGTLSIVVLISVVNELPFATRAGTSSMLQISGELEEAATIQGASWFQRFRKIIIPISRKSLVSVFLISFIGTMKEMELIIMLITPKTSTLTTLTFSYAEKGYPQYSAASVLLIIAIILGFYFMAAKWFKADMTKGIGG